MKINKYEQGIRELISRTIKLTHPIDTIRIDLDLQTIGMDSMSFIKLVVEIENKFDIQFPDDKLVISEANTINKLCDIISSNKLEQT